MVCDRLTWDDLEGCPFLLNLRDRAAIAVMNDAVPEPKTATSALLTMAMGQTLRAEATDESAFAFGEPASGIGKATDGVQSGEGSPGFRAGYNIVHANAQSLARRKLLDAGLGAALARAGKRVLICGNADTDRPGRRAVLLAMDGQGHATGDIASAPGFSGNERPGDDVVKLARYAARTDADLFVVALGDLERLEAQRGSLSASAFQERRRKGLASLDTFFVQLFAVQHLDLFSVDVLLVSSCPPDVRPWYRPEIPGSWPQLTPVLGFGSNFASCSLTSSTTRTDGLVANTDLAPTILTSLGVPVPATIVGRPFMRGNNSPIGPVGPVGPTPWEVAARIAFVGTMDADSWLTVVLPIGVGVLALVLGAIIAYWSGGVNRAKRWRPGLVCVQTMPATFLLCTLWIPPTLLEYGLRMVVWMLVLTGISYLGSRLFHTAPVLACAWLTIILIVVDLLCGQPLLKSSLISNYALGGVRYYGIGNEYLGVVLSYALLIAFGGNTEGDDNAAKPRILRFGVTLACFLFLAFMLGWPGLGANSGSLIVTGAGFTVALWGLSGRPFRWLVALIGLALGIGASVLFAALDARMGGGQASHAGHVLNATTHGRGAGYLVEIMVRKVGMNLHMLIQPYYLLGLVAFGLVLYLLRKLLSGVVAAMFREYPQFHKILAPMGVTLVASIIFKDSGVVTAAFMAGLTCMFLLYYLVGVKE